jgi:pyruvate kinase
MDAGMTMARLNLSHGSTKDNVKLIQNFRNAKRLRPHKNCALMVEIRGREVRISHNEEKGNILKVRTGSTVKMFGGEFEKPSDTINFRVNSDYFQRYMRPNDMIYVDDGKVIGVVIEINQRSVTLEIK